MKVLLDIKDDKAAFLLELLSNFKYVKVSPVSPESLDVMMNLSEAVTEVNEIKAGYKKSKPLSDFLDEL